MQFLEPDPSRYRISDCGRYLVEKISIGADTMYCLWVYSTQAGGYRSLEEARVAAMEREFNRWEAAAEVGTVNYDDCDQKVAERKARPREAVAADFGLF